MEGLRKKNSLKNSTLLLVLLSGIVSAQYAPAAGHLGTTAIHKDSTAFVNWAVSCDVQLGLQDVSNTVLGNASVGTNTSVIGAADGRSVVSLGDGGVAVVQFSAPITNGEGPDFAVFENSFSDDFLELAFVEVSSDGVNYVRFPASSLTQTSTQVASFGTLDPTKLYNLAGKYRGGYGTPFDLEELKNAPGLNVNSVTHVKIIDVIGTVNTQYASYDAAGNVINDPWPTAFASSGFDLDGVGVINSTSTSVNDLLVQEALVVYPNPVRDQINIASNNNQWKEIQLIDIRGEIVKVLSYSAVINIGELPSGIYFLKLISSSSVLTKKVTLVHD